MRSSWTSEPPIQPWRVMASSTAAAPSETIVLSCIPIVPQSLAWSPRSSYTATNRATPRSRPRVTMVPTMVAIDRA